MLTKNKINDIGANTVPQSVQSPQTTRRGINASKSTLLADTVNAREGGRDGVTGKKASRRGALVKDRWVLAWVVAELPCQKAIVGATYRNGQPVFACVKYREQIIYYPATGEKCTVFDKFSGSATFKINKARFGWDQVGGNKFTFSVQADGTIVCRESHSNQVGVVWNQAGVENFARRVCRGWCFNHYQTQLSGYLTKDKLDKAMDKIRGAVEAALVRRAVLYWLRFVQNVV